MTKFAFALLTVTLKTRWYVSISICVEVGIDAARSVDSEPNTKRLRDELNELVFFYVMLGIVCTFAWNKSEASFAIADDDYSLIDSFSIFG